MRTVAAMVQKFWYVPVMTILFAFVVPSTIEDFFLPGTQPGQGGSFDANLSCNCHSDTGTEETLPHFSWRGSMMAQSMRDPLFTATMTIANQDAPESGDLCLRCHSPPTTHGPLL